MVISSQSAKSLGRERARRVAAAEAKSPFNECTRIIRNEDGFEHVSVYLAFYPKERWMVKFPERKGQPVEVLTQEFRDATEPFRL